MGACVPRGDWVVSRPILVIEDGDDDFAVLSESLRIADVPNELIRCSNGREISAYLRNAASLPLSRYPVMILLDLNLPGADGRNVLREVRNHPLLCAVPVVILSTSSHPADIETSYRLGASAYMVKPMELDRFETMVRKMTEYWLGCVQLPQYPHWST
jgi:CheY-like chemotaxis protein